MEKRDLASHKRITWKDLNARPSMGWSGWGELLYDITEVETHNRMFQIVPISYNSERGQSTVEKRRREIKNPLLDFISSYRFSIHLYYYIFLFFFSGAITEKKRREKKIIKKTE